MTHTIHCTVLEEKDISIDKEKGRLVIHRPDGNIEEVYIDTEAMCNLIEGMTSEVCKRFEEQVKYCEGLRDAIAERNNEEEQKEEEDNE